MKRNKELDKLFGGFVKDLMLLVRESKTISSDKNKDISEIDLELDTKLINSKKTLREQFKDGEDSFEFKESPIRLLDRRNKLYRIEKLSHNGTFLYAVALFENFASKAIKIIIKNGGRSEKSPRKRYINKFKKFANKHAESGNHKFTDMFTEFKKMVDNYDELPDVLNLWLYVFDINKEGIFKSVKPRYIEIRERRNLLVHRGTIIDQRYKKSFIKANMASDKGEQAKKLLDSIIERYSFEDTNGVNLSVTPRYIVFVFEHLLTMSFLLYINSFKLSKEEIDESIFPENLLHDIMIFADETHETNVLYLLESLIVEYKNSLGDKKISNIPAIDKANVLIIRVYMIDFYEDMYKRTMKNLSSDETPKENIVETKKWAKQFKIWAEKEREKFHLQRKDFEKSIDLELNPNLKKSLILIDSHFEGNVEKLINNIKKIESIDYRDLDTWFMFKKYQENIKFKEFKKTLPKPDSVVVNFK